MNTKSRLSRCWWLGMSCCLAIGGAIAGGGDRVCAQITPDATLGAERSSVVTPNVVSNGLPSDRIDGGAIRSSNLFHSFVQFNVDAGRAAYFTNPAGIKNILSRVTGGSRSEILGKLGVLGNANLFLINPNGIIFGPNSSLDVKGSFVATSADRIQFGNQGFFSTSAPDVPPVLTVNPSALLFNQVAAQPITNQSVAGLSVPNGQSLLLVGGNVSLDGGSLYARGGRIELGGLAGTGTVGLNVDNNNLSLSFPDVVERADVSLSNDAEVNVRAGGGGSIAINAQNLNLAGGSKLRAGIASKLGSSDSKAGDIDINAIGAITLTDSSFVANVVEPQAVGKGGDINIETESVKFTDGSNLIASTYGHGDAGSVTINVRDTVSFDGEDQGPDFPFSGVYSRVEKGAVGNGGNINVTTRSLSATNGAVLTTSIDGQGNAGNVNIDAYDTVSFDGQSSLHGDSRQSSGAFSAVKENGVGQGGSVNVKTGSLSLTNGAIVSASTLGRGNAGSVTINARDTVSFDGEGPNFSASSAYSEVASAAVGQGGSVNVTTGFLSVTNGAVLSASTYGRGDAGSVIINARDTASFDGEGRLHENYLHEDYRNTSAVYSQVTPSGMGNGGKVNVTTGSLYVTHGAALQASTRGQGNAGSVTINVRNTASFNGEGGSPNFFSSGAYTRFEKDAVGNGGDVSITAGSLSLTNGALIQANTLGKGSAGSVKIDVRDRASFDGVGPADSLPSGAYSQVEKDAVGNGGDINVTAGLLSLTNGAVLNASSDGQGNAGNIFASVHGTLQANNGTISTSATKFSGGAIDINARDIRLHGNSDIKTNVASGAGNGGNINLSARSIFAFDNSDILAYARDGRGGNITLKTPTFFGYRYLPTPRSTDPATLDHNNRVDINASGAFTGIITLPDSSFVQNSLTSLPTNVIDTSNLIANSCIARGRHQKGSFLITGAGGLPTRPDDPENAPFQTYVVPMVGVSSRQHSTVSSTSPARLWKLGDPIVEPQGVYRLPDGQLILSRECQRQQ